jgi:ribosomal protein L12E/L44/L45/RPP1/RPP2
MVETKVLKQRVRDCIDPARDLGHSDKGGKKKKEQEGEAKEEEKKEDGGEEGGVKITDGTVCEDCK